MRRALTAAITALAAVVTLDLSLVADSPAPAAAPRTSEMTGIGSISSLTKTSAFARTRRSM